MLVGGVVIGGALGFAGSALKQGSAIEDRTRHLYTADAGVESAWQRLSTGNFTGMPLSYSMTMSDGLVVDVTISLLGDHSPISKLYAVHSVAVSSTGKTTTIDAKLETRQGDYYYFLDNVVTCQKNVDIKNKVDIAGWIDCGTHSGKVPDWQPSGSPPPDGYGFRSDGPPMVWPTSTELTAYYSKEVPSGSSNYHTGGWSPSGDVTLTGTTYVAGDFRMSSGTLNLNGFTLFVDGNVYIHHADVNPPITQASGCIVATKNVEFWPNQQTGNSPYGVFVFCLGSAGAEFQPGGDFYGWIAAQNGVQLKSGEGPTYHWVDPDINVPLDFPGLEGPGGPGERAGHVKIVTWKTTY